MFMKAAFAAMDAAKKAVELYPTIRDALTTENQAELDAAYAALTAEAKQVNDELQAIPDDPT